MHQVDTIPDSHYYSGMMIRFTVRLPEDLHARVSAEAKATGRYINQIIESALNEYLRRTSETPLIYLDIPCVVIKWEEFERLQKIVDGDNESD